MQNSKPTKTQFRRNLIFGAILALLFIGCSPESTEKDDPKSTVISKNDFIKQIENPDLIINSNSKSYEEEIEIEVEGEEIVQESSFFGIIEKSEFKGKLKNDIIEGTFYWEDFDLFTGESLDWASGEIICISLKDDKTVNIAGIVTDTNSPVLIGTYALWIAQDDNENGDFSTLIFTGYPQPFADYHCETGFSFEQLGADLIEFNNGKIKVKSEY